MKRKIKWIGLWLVLVFIGSPFLYGVTTTPRTENNLQIWDSITVTPSVKRAVLKTPKVDETEKIYDFANLLSETEEQKLYQEVVKAIDQRNLDMVVVTINENNKRNAEAYADDFYDYNYFGKGSTYDGILLLIDMDNREVYISTTGKAQLIYDDTRINKMLDVIQPKLSNTNYYSAVYSFIQDSNRYAKDGIPKSNENSSIDKNGNYISNGYRNQNIMVSIFKILVFPTIITIIVIAIGCSTHRNVKIAKLAKIYLKKGSVNVNRKEDQFIRSATSTVRRSTSSGSSGGSSTHHSSSGRSHGGGGRHF